MKRKIISLLCASLLIALPACMCDKNNSCCSKSSACEQTIAQPEEQKTISTEAPLETAVETEHDHAHEADHTHKF